MKDFLIRLLSALVFGPLMLVFVFLGHWYLYFLILVVCALGLYELAGLTRSYGVEWPVPVALAGSALSLAGGISHRPLLMVAGPVLAFILGAGFSLFGREPVHSTALGLPWVIVGSVWLGLFPAHFLYLRSGAHGLWTAGTALLATWAYDVFAYLGGLAWGSRHFAGQVSPGKTVEGAALGTVASVGLLFVAGIGFLGLTWWKSVVAGLVLAAAAQVGDLTESALKRQAGVKDSGRLIPGHGGVLDRFDSLLFVAPAAVYLLQVL